MLITKLFKNSIRLFPPNNKKKNKFKFKNIIKIYIIVKLLIFFEYCACLSDFLVKPLSWINPKDFSFISGKLKNFVYKRCIGAFKTLREIRGKHRRPLQLLII